MKYTTLRKIAFFILITFVSMILAPQKSYSKPGNDEFEKGKSFYTAGDYDKATEILTRFIEKYQGSENYKSQLADAFYYIARIHFSSEEYEKMEETLTSLFTIDLAYGFLLEKDLEFIKKANEIRDRLKIEREKLAPKVIVKEINGKAKKKFPWLLVAGVVVVGAVAAVLLSKKKIIKKMTLTVTVGEGVEGTPATGTYSYSRGETVNYNYTMKGGYNTLTVKLDGNEVSLNGSIKMDQNHSLAVSASKKYTLTVVKREGVSGTPDSGTHAYNEGETVNYNYTLQSGYENLTVTIDGVAASSTGAITMDRDHTLAAYSGKTYRFTVTKSVGVEGIPGSGTFIYSEGEIVTYSYALQSGFKDLVVKIDGIQVPSSGSIPMDKDHTLTTAATLIAQYTLTVSRGAGVNGTPESGTYNHNEGTTVNYNYTLQEGYQNLIVTLDGNPVSPSGTITINKNYILNASATLINQYTLTVSKGDGVNGAPNSGAFPYNNGASATYNYTLQDGYNNLVVTLDGNPVNASGTIAMNSNHTLSASATSAGTQYTLTVSRGTGVSGTPNTGTISYEKGKAVKYSYNLETGYQDLLVKLDGNTVEPDGTIIMNTNHTLTASATRSYALNVTRGAGVEGNPNSGTYYSSAGGTFDYSYTLQPDYQNLAVTIDNVPVSVSGTITMDKDHTLVASATKQWKLTVEIDEGVEGNPGSGVFTYANGASQAYNYSLKSGYTNLVVTLDGNSVPSTGTFTMNMDHTLTASTTVVTGRNIKK